MGKVRVAKLNQVWMQSSEIIILKWLKAIKNILSSNQNIIKLALFWKDRVQCVIWEISVFNIMINIKVPRYWIPHQIILSNNLIYHNCEPSSRIFSLTVQMMVQMISPVFKTSIAPITILLILNHQESRVCNVKSTKFHKK